jgi:hypothetical protein
MLPGRARTSSSPARSPSWAPSRSGRPTASTPADATPRTSAVPRWAAEPVSPRHRFPLPVSLLPAGRRAIATVSANSVRRGARSPRHAVGEVAAGRQAVSALRTGVMPVAMAAGAMGAGEPGGVTSAAPVDVDVQAGERKPVMAEEAAEGRRVTSRPGWLSRNAHRPTASGCFCRVCSSTSQRA